MILQRTFLKWTQKSEKKSTTRLDKTARKVRERRFCRLFVGCGLWASHYHLRNEKSRMGHPEINMKVFSGWGVCMRSTTTLPPLPNGLRGAVIYLWVSILHFEISVWPLSFALCCIHLSTFSSRSHSRLSSVAVDQSLHLTTHTPLERKMTATLRNRARITRTFPSLAENVPFLELSDDCVGAM